QGQNNSTFGGCFADCASGKQCPGDLECSTTLGNSCLGPAPVGPITLGGTCSTEAAKVEKEGCAKGLFCIAFPRETKGICTKDCSADPKVCDAAKIGTMSCVTTDPQNNVKNCLHACGNPGQTCPTGTACRTGSNFCFPPNTSTPPTP
ncbi:MAG: hypothetical protein AAGJ35_11315, partial [Myxococcota bacterium]